MENSFYTGVYWGAFDPLTKAHTAIIQAALSSPIFTNLFIVVNNHSYKKYTYPLSQRIEEIEKALPTQSRVMVRFLSQDDSSPCDYFFLKTLSSLPLCAIAGYDSYKIWGAETSFDAIALVPRGDETPVLFDRKAFLLEIDPSYRHISSAQLKKN